MSTVQPPVPYAPPPTAPQTPVEGEAVTAPVTRLPPSLAANERDIALRGEVQGQNADGTTRITTPRGPIDVRLPEPTPARGQAVDVQLPAGTPPRTATVTVPQTPQPSTPPQTQPAPTPATPPAVQLPNTPPPITLPPQTPLPQTPAPQSPTGAPPQQGQQPGPQITPQPGQPSGPQGQPVTAQGLMSFLKTSLQTILKSPAARDAPNVPPPANTVLQTPAAQRPLQLGQMARLTPLPAGQMLSPLATPTSSPLAGAGLTTGMGASTPSLQITPLQITSAQGATIMAPALNTASTTIDPLARLLLPLTGAAPQTPAPASASPVLGTLMQTIKTQMADALATMTGTNTAARPAPQAGVPTINTHTTITVPNGPLAQPQLQALDVRVMGFLPQASPAAMQNAGIANLLGGTPQTPVLFAQVTGQSIGGLPVVTLPGFTIAPDGTQRPAPVPMVLQFPTRGLAPASVLQLGILPGTPAGAAPAMPGGMNVGIGAMGGLSQSMAWQALDDVLRAGPTAQGQSGANAQAALAAALPKPGGAAFTAPVLMMASALRSGDIAAWLGDKGLEAVRNSRRADALARVSADFATTSRAASDEARPMADWRSITLPLSYGQEVTRVMLHYHGFERDGDGSTGPGKQKGTRFVMDLSLTRMGPMQIDGFSLGRKLDVTLRSEQAMSAGMREAMRLRYHEAVSGIGFAGELNFASAPGRKGWMNF